MGEQTALTRVARALRDPLSVGLVKSVFARHYGRFFDYEDAHQLLETAFSDLVLSQRGQASNFKLHQVLQKLWAGIYSREHNPGFFKAYSEYKAVQKPAYYYQLMRGDFLGSRTLDFGSGKGYLSVLLKSQGYSPINADIFNFDETALHGIPFLRLDKTSVISRMIEPVDTITCVTVLHHIDSATLPRILSELSLIGK